MIEVEGIFEGIWIWGRPCFSQARSWPLGGAEYGITATKTTAVDGIAYPVLEAAAITAETKGGFNLG